MGVPLVPGVTVRTNVEATNISVICTTLHNSWNQAIASIKPCRAAGSTVALDASAVVRKDKQH